MPDTPRPTHFADGRRIVPWTETVTAEDLHPDDDGSARPYANNTGFFVVALGECSTCDHYRQQSGPRGFFPSHTAGRGCRSGKRDHCTCDGCF